MKICIISGDVVGGLRKHVHDILTLAPENIEFLYIHSEVFDVTAQIDFLNLEKIGIKRIPLNIPKNPVILDIKNILIIWRLCRDNHVDLLHGHSAKGGLYARFVGLLLGKPVFYTPHGGAVHSRFGKLKSMIFASVEFVLKFATSLFVFESQYTSAAFEKLAGGIPACRKFINYNGVNLEYFSFISDARIDIKRKVRLLTVGLLNKVKGQDVVIDAVSILQSRGWDISLDLCGGGDGIRSLQEQVNASQLNNSIRFHGDVSDVRSYYQSCDIVVIPSRFESFGYVAVEAALIGKPIVASATGGLLETVINRQTGIIFKVGCPNDLANAVEEVLEDVEATKRRIYDGRKRAIALFDVNKMANRLYEKYYYFTSK